MLHINAILSHLSHGRQKEKVRYHQDKKVELIVSVPDVKIMIQPSQIEGDILTPLEDEKRKIIVVHITLKVPASVKKPKRIKCMLVELQADELLIFPDGYVERNKRRQVRAEVSSAKSILIGGGETYTWDVPLRISHEIAPSDYGSHGRMLQKISVKLSWSGWRGIFKRIERQQPVIIFTNSDGDRALQYASDLTGEIEDLGPVLFCLYSQHFCVGGFVRVAASFPRLPQRTTLVAIYIAIIQVTTMQSRIFPTLLGRCYSTRSTFSTISTEQLSLCDSGNGKLYLNGEWIARLPDDRSICPTTLAGSTEAAIRHTHQLELKVDFFREARSLTYNLRTVVVMPGCCNLWKSVRLPTYSVIDPSPVPELRYEALQHSKYRSYLEISNLCTCGLPLEKLLSWEKECDNEQGFSSIDNLRKTMESEMLRIKNLNRDSDMSPILSRFSPASSVSKSS